MIKKERYISNTDYELLKKLYPNNMDEIIKKINNDYPIQYLIGDVDFYGYTIKVGKYPQHITWNILAVLIG